MGNFRHYDEIRSDNSTGHKGICYLSNVDMYEAYIYHKSKKIYLGIFKDIEDAIDKRKQAEKEIWGKDEQ